MNDNYVTGVIILVVILSCLTVFSTQLTEAVRMLPAFSEHSLITDAEGTPGVSLACSQGSFCSSSLSTYLKNIGCMSVIL